MKANYLFLVSVMLFIQISYSQVGIGTPSPDPSSELEVSSPLNDKGVLIPRMNQAQRNAIASPAISLLIYQTDNTPGFYYFNGTVWVGITAGASTDWTLLGNAGTVATTNFFGTTDDVDIVLNRNGVRAGFIGNPIGATPSTIDRKNTSFGANSLLTPATGYRNTAIGSNVLTVNTTGFRNVAIGNESLAKNNIGNTNVAVGDLSMFENLTGTSNTAVGTGSLYSNTAGTNNTAIGRNALTASTASFDTALGDRALEFNTTGANNVATGNNSLNKNIGGSNNTATGVQALRSNTTGGNNTAIGYQTLSGNPTILANISTFSNSTAVGYQSFYNNLTGSNNVGLGYQAGFNELGTDKLYIENTNADANNALIYGDFTAGAKILRTNSTFQIGNPAITGYSFPTARPATAAGQVLQYNAVGALTFQTPAVALNSYAWLTTGNSGMIAATNFIGTTDANPLVFKTTAVERMRILATGEVVVGTGSPVAGDKISAYATGNVFAVNGYSTSTGAGVFGDNTGTGTGVFGRSISAGTGIYGQNNGLGEGVFGVNTSTGVGVEGDATGTGIGVFGFNNGTGPAVFGNNTVNGVGVQGQSVGNNSGVYGFNNSNLGRGVYGNNTAGGVGVQGQSTATGAGVLGTNSATGVGVQGQSISTGIGVYGINNATGTAVFGNNIGGGNGVKGQSVLTGVGVIGYNSSTGVGVQGQSVTSGTGVYGINSGTGVGVYGLSDTTGSGVFGTNNGAGAGVQGQNSSTGAAVFGNNTGTGVGVYGQTLAGSTSYAVFANGNMGATGTKTFYIDHPTDPENKYLRHFALESNEVLNVYRGNVVLNSNGEATVSLPDYFDAVNVNFSYNLTSIGSKSEVFIKEEISNNKFKIAGGNPNQKISWQVYAERNDLYLQKYPENRKVEVDKKSGEKGKYLMPELFNQSKDKGIFYSKSEKLNINNSIETEKEIVPIEITTQKEVEIIKLNKKIITINRN